MSIISAKNLEYGVGVETILENVSFIVNEKDRIGIVGVNGAGKSTLLKLLVGEYEPDDGELSISKGATIGYLKQREHFDAGQTVMDVMMNVSSEVKAAFEDAHGYAYDRAAEGLLRAMRFDDEYFNRDVGLLSGGEKTRLALCALLVREPDILLLDEPTNHLDLPMLKWLENYLKGYKGTLLIVSHDRYFLDKCVNRIFEIENCTLTAYSGNYSQYKEQKQRNFEIDMKHYLAQMEEIKRQEELITRWKQRGTEHLTKRARSREKRLAHITMPVKPTQLTESLKLCFDEKISSGNDVVKMMDVSFSYDLPGSGEGSGEYLTPPPTLLFKNANLDIKKGDRICIVGENGIGKTTLIKLLLGTAGMLESVGGSSLREHLIPNTGRIVLGVNVVPGYYDQEQQALNPNATVLDEIHSVYIKYSETELRKILGSFLFHGDDVFKQVKDLAGGEKARLALLKLMMSGANLLVFDEPTNHLDISAKEIFEEAIRKFPGTVIIVSHDRYLLQHVPTAICELTPEGIVRYPGNYDYYEEKRSQANSTARRPDSYESGVSGGNVFFENTSQENVAAAGNASQDTVAAAETWEEKKAREREERKAQKAKAEAEAKVTELEVLVAELEEKAALAAEDAAQKAASKDSAEAIENLTAISGSLEAAKKDLEVALEHWMELAD